MTWCVGLVVLVLCGGSLVSCMQALQFHCGDFNIDAIKVIYHFIVFGRIFYIARQLIFTSYYDSCLCMLE